MGSWARPWVSAILGRNSRYLDNVSKNGARYQLAGGRQLIPRAPRWASGRADRLGVRLWVTSVGTITGERDPGTEGGEREIETERGRQRREREGERGREGEQREGEHARIKRGRQVGKARDSEPQVDRYRPLLPSRWLGKHIVSSASDQGRCSRITCSRGRY